MLPREILKLRSSEIAVNAYFSIFAFSKLSRRVTKLQEKGKFSRVFEKWGGTANQTGFIWAPYDLKIENKFCPKCTSVSVELSVSGK